MLIYTIQPAAFVLFHDSMYAWYMFYFRDILLEGKSIALTIHTVLT